MENKFLEMLDIIIKNWKDEALDKADHANMCRNEAEFRVAVDRVKQLNVVLNLAQELKDAIAGNIRAKV